MELEVVEMRMIWILPLLGAFLGGAQLLELGSAQSAPQQAAGAAMACGYAIIPYVFARAIQAFADADYVKTQIKLLADIANRP